MKKSEIFNNIEKKKVCCVIREQSPEKCLEIANAVIRGGIDIIEISMDCGNPAYVISELAKNENIMVGASSVITFAQASIAQKAGAKYLVSPVFEMSIVKFSKGFAMPLIIGASTANEAYESWKLNTMMTKIFPAKAMGGPEYIKEILKAMPFLKLVPTSGIEVEDFVDYLKAGAVAVSIGHSLYSGIEGMDVITERARTVKEKLNNYLATI